MRGDQFKTLYQFLLDQHFIPEMGYRRKRSGHHEVHHLGSEPMDCPNWAERKRFCAIQFRNQHHELLVLMKDQEQRGKLVCDYPVSTAASQLQLQNLAKQDPTLLQFPTVAQVKDSVTALLDKTA